MAEVTIAAPFVQKLLEGATLRGYDVPELLIRQGISPHILRNSKNRLPAEHYSRLAPALTALMSDEAWGLMDKPVVPGAFGLMSRAALSCLTVSEALKVCADFYAALGSSLHSRLEHHDDQATLVLERRHPRGLINHYIIDSTLVGIHRLQCWLADEFLPIDRVELDYPEPEYVEEYRYVFYGAPMYFDRPRNSLTFNNRMLQRRCVRTKGELVTLLSNPNETLLAQTRKSRSLAVKLRYWIEQSIREQHDIGLESASRRFAMGSQTIRRRLKNEGTSYQKIKDDTRRDIAIDLVTSRRQSVEQIAESLAFSEASTFIRAFKSWTGLTPLAFRALYTGQNSRDATPEIP